jgi:3-oxoacyl-[acyl-carrier-protein] synthase II
MSSRQVVITGIGAITSAGSSAHQMISSLKKGMTGFEYFNSDCVICAIKDFDLNDYTGRFKNKRYLNRGASLAVAAAMTAIKNSCLDDDALNKAGLYTGAGPNLDIENEFPEIKNHRADWQKIQALWMLKFLPNTAASVISQLAGIHGECITFGTACAASLQAIGEAYRKIKDGYLDIALAGGGDSRLNSGAMMAYKKARSIYVGDDHPDHASRPFDHNRKGFVPGEGAAFFMLEEKQHAMKRNADIHAEILGFGVSIDGYRMTDPHPKGIYAQEAVMRSLQEANLNPKDIDVIASHGTGTVQNDRVEADLIDCVFGESAHVIALKSWIGHLSAACGAAELSLCLACIKYNYIPEIRNLYNPCHSTVNFVRSPKKYSYRKLLLENFGFGGQNCVIIIDCQKNRLDSGDMTFNS